MHIRQSYISLLMIALIPMVLAACSSKKTDLGDSAGVTIGQAADLNQGTLNQGTVIGNGLPPGAVFNDGYGMGAPLGNVDSSIIPGSQADMAAQAGSDIVFFETNSHSLTSQGRSVVEGQARWLNNYPNLTVSVEGHADERGTREYNIALGDRRANAVKNYLIAVGLAPSRVNTISYGKEQPLVVGDGYQSWSQNRRSKTRVN